MVEYLVPKEGELPLGAVEKSLSRGAGCVLLFLLLCVQANALTFPAVPTVRVLVERERSVLAVEGFDVVVREVKSQKEFIHERQMAALEFHCGIGSKVSVKLKSKQKQKPFTIRGPVAISSLGGFLRVDRSQFREELYLYSHNNECVLVNHVDLEKYVVGLLNSEMADHWNRSALQAQAIAARTYALYQMQENATVRYRELRPFFDLNSSVKDQVYEGAHQERYNAMRAVQDTRGIVLTHDGQLIKAFYHSTCGGTTQSPDAVWPSSKSKFSYFKPVKCGFCKRSPRFNWEYRAPLSQVRDVLARAGVFHGELRELRVKARSPMGRVEELELVSAKQDLPVPLRAFDLREILGNRNVRSTNFELKMEDSSQGQIVVFVGHGSGHGVGMCQWGARALGERKWPAEKILTHYYPMAKLERWYN